MDVGNFEFSVEPKDLKIQITDDCNMRCSFCYHGAGGVADRYMPTSVVEKWITWARDNGIEQVRFTGGEPTLHPDIVHLCYYAKKLRLYVILNTNGCCDSKLLDDILPNIDDIRISLPDTDSVALDKTTGVSDVFKIKDISIKKSLQYGVKTIILTVLTPEIKGRLIEFVDYLIENKGLLWGPMRFEPTPTNVRPWSRHDAQDFAEEISHLMDEFPDHVKGIFMAIPFCSVTPASLGARVFAGKTFTCGPYASLTVGIDGNIYACPGVCEFPGALSLDDIRNSSEFKHNFSINALPAGCRDCEYVQRCAGGCRKQFALVDCLGGKCDYLSAWGD